MFDTSKVSNIFVKPKTLRVIDVGHRNCKESATKKRLMQHQSIQFFLYIGQHRTIFMKSYLLLISAFIGSLHIQSCTNTCCPDEISILDNEITPPVDSMPKSYWWKKGEDSTLINFDEYKKDFYYMKSEFEEECGFLGLINSQACESMTKVKTISLIDTSAQRVLQFHFYPYNYSPFSHNGNKVKLTLRTPEYDNDIEVFDFLYEEDGYSQYKELEWDDVNRSRIKSVEYDLAKGLQKLELNEGLVIYSAQ